MRPDHIHTITTVLSCAYLDDDDRTAYRDSSASMLAQVPPDERWAQLPDLLLGLPGEALARNRASARATNRAQRALHLLILPAALVMLLIASVQMHHAVVVLTASTNAERLSVAMTGAAQIQVLSPLWAVATTLLAVLIPLSWTLHPPAALRQLHVIVLVPIMTAVSTVPGLHIPALAVLAGWLLAALAAWCVWTRPETAI